MAYHTLSQGIRDARETGQTLVAATGVVGKGWLLLRQDRFDEAERLATITAQEVEPRMSNATPGQLAVWGEWTRSMWARPRRSRSTRWRRGARSPEPRPAYSCWAAAIPRATISVTTKKTMMR